MKVAHIGNPISLRPKTNPRQEALQDFQRTKQFSQRHVRDLRAKLFSQDLTTEQRVAAREAFQRFNQVSKEITKEFRGSDATSASEYAGRLTEALQGLGKAINGIIGPGEDYSGPKVNGGSFPGSGVGGNVNVRA